MLRKIVTTTAACLFAGFGSAYAAHLFVSPAGDDANIGSKSAASGFAGKEDMAVHVADGVYYLPETLMFTSGDSGSENHRVVYEANNKGRVVLNGGSEIELSWEPYKNGILAAQAPSGLKFEQFFVGDPDAVCDPLFEYGESRFEIWRNQAAETVTFQNK